MKRKRTNEILFNFKSPIQSYFQKKKTIKRPETRIYSTLPSHIIIANFKLSNFLDKSPYLLSTIKYSITQQHPHSYVIEERKKTSIYKVFRYPRYNRDNSVYLQN